MDSLVSLITLIVCVWILVTIGAKTPTAIKGFNRRVKKSVRGFIRGLLKDD